MEINTAKKLDVLSIFRTSIGHFMPWLAIVLFITWSGYPGVVCITPMAWLLAISLGSVHSGHSKSQKSSTRMLEAALAGGILGLLQGVLFIVITPVMGPIKPEEEVNTMILNLIMVGVGALVTAILSLFSAMSMERRRKKKMSLREYESVMRDLGM